MVSNYTSLQSPANTVKGAHFLKPFRAIIICGTSISHLSKFRSSYTARTKPRQTMLTTAVKYRLSSCLLLKVVPLEKAFASLFVLASHFFSGSATHLLLPAKLYTTFLMFLFLSCPSLISKLKSSAWSDTRNVGLALLL